MGETGDDTLFDIDLAVLFIMNKQAVEQNDDGDWYAGALRVDRDSLQKLYRADLISVGVRLLGPITATITDAGRERLVREHLVEPPARL